MAGLVNGLIITYGRVNAVIATLGTMAIFRGIAFIMSDGELQALFPALIDGEPPALRQPLTEAGVMRWACESSQE